MYAYKNNDECAKIIIDRYVEDFSEVLLDYCNIFRPDKIIIGGGLSYTEEIIGMVAKKCKEKNFGYSNACSVEIIPAALKNNAGILGASVLF
jgi:predicted NBD/HSP70 family sugar kinase